jgi:hypothetical protein
VTRAEVVVVGGGHNRGRLEVGAYEHGGLRALRRGGP